MTAGAAALALAAATGCSSPDGSRTGSPPAAADAPADVTARDADLLGRHALQLLDQAASYRSSHRGRLPTSVAQLGLDSLTPDMVQRIRVRNDSALVQVAFRRAGSHALAWCEASEAALEEASLAAGAFSVSCQRTGGAIDSFTVGGTR